MLDAENSRSCWQMIDSNCKKNGTLKLNDLYMLQLSVITFVFVTAVY